MAEHVMKVSEEELQQMRRDREKMSEEFQHFLEVNLKKSAHDDNKSQIECEEQKVMHSLNVTQVARNLNESPRSPLHLSPRDGMKTPRGISSSSIRCAAGGAKAVKSVEEKKLCKKVKNYDPIETRRFMRDQQKKRQVELRKGELDDRTRKLEIQKRLNELQESTKRILGKSSGKKCGKTATSPKVARSLKLVDQDAIKGNDTTPRKSATYENVSETPKVPQDDLGVKSKIPQIPEIVEKMPQSPSKSVSEGKKVPEEKLEAPSHLKLSKGVKKKKNSNIPHWLKPTTVNIYPYDFITSVRE